MSGTKISLTPSECDICKAKLTVHCLNALRAHLACQHNLTAVEAWHHYNGPIRPTCVQCKGSVKFISFVKGYELLCGVCNKKNSQLRGAETRKSKKIPAWNKGLTEKSSGAVKRAAEGCRAFIQRSGHWNKGKTKENSEHIRRAAAKISVATRETWKSGRHGLIGKNASNHPGIKHRGKQISLAYKTNKGTHWTKRSDAGDIAKRIISTRKQLIESGVRSPFRLTKADVKERLLSYDDYRDHDIVTYSGHKSIVTVTCRSCSLEHTIGLDKLNAQWACPCKRPRSVFENEIYEFVRTLKVDVKQNDRNMISPRELDVYVPEDSFAIECNGLYWHSDTYKEIDEHSRKTTLAMNKNIKLFHIFEDEWRDKRSIIESMIRVRLNAANKIHARTLTVVSGKAIRVKQFMIDNHIDSYARARYAVWLEDDNGNIVMALTLRTPHQHSTWHNAIEIARVASIKNTVVVGGLSRLIKHAIAWARDNEFDKMITYMDERLGGDGKGYTYAGFNLSHRTQPRWWWTDYVNRYDRFSVRAIKELNVRQDELADSLRLARIGGCVNRVYVRNLKMEVRARDLKATDDIIS